MLQALAFLGVAFTTVGLIHYYLWRKLVRATTRTRRSRRIGTWLVVGAAVFVVATFVAEDRLPSPYAELFVWPGYIWLAIMFYLFVGLLLLEIPTLIARLVIRRTAKRPEAAVRAPALVGAGLSGASASGAADREGPAEQPVEPPAGPDDPALSGTPAPPDLVESRRLFLARAAAVTVGVAAVGLVGPGVATALGPPRLKRVQIPLAKLSRGSDGLRIALVSDIHLSTLTGVTQSRRVVDMVNALDADLVAIVGDLVDGSVEDRGPAAAPLRDLRSRHGAFFVTGNHEYFSGHEQWVEELPRLGLRLLRNERVQLPGGLDLAGVNDLVGTTFGDGPDIARAMADRDPARPVVLLAHQPAQAAEAARHGVDLQLSGHTHGGQMVPFNLIVRASGQPVVSGLGEVGGMPVYVTNGAGFWGPPVRVGALPDITLIELRAAG